VYCEEKKSGFKKERFGHKRMTSDNNAGPSAMWASYRGRPRQENIRSTKDPSGEKNPFLTLLYQATTV
jgi:hypothetical protein